MGRSLRQAAGDVVFHVINRAAGRRQIFDTPQDYAAFEAVLAAAHDKVAMRTLAYCVMPNHWHLVLWPRTDSDLSRFVGWLTLTHTQRWHAWRGSTGTGPLYQGRFKSFPAQTDGHFLTLCRYVERNALRAGLATRAEDWRWSSLRHLVGDPEGEAPPLAPWPMPRPDDWLDWVNRPQPAEEIEDLRLSVVRGRPYGEAVWISETAERFGLQGSLRPRGRPKKVSDTFF